MLAVTMKVTLPDGSGLDLPDGASGLDAAAAIGSRLAKAAVAVQVDGEVRDVRLPLHDGETLRILTDRDPEALAVLRHSTAHVMAQAVLHLWPEAKIAIGPAIADGFYYDFEFPRADRGGRPRADRGRDAPDPAAPGRVRARGRTSTRPSSWSASGPSTSRTSSSSPRACPTARSASTATTTSRICAAGRTCRPPRRSARSSCSRRRVRTGAATPSKPMLTRIYGTAFFKQADLDEHLRLLEEARRRDHRRIGRELDLFHTSRGRARRAVLASARHGDLERADPALARAEPRPRATARCARRSSTRSRCGGAPATGTSTATTCSSRTRTSARWA